MKYTVAALAAAVAIAQAAPVDQVCLPYTTVVYGSPIWKPTPGATSYSTKTETWTVWDPSTSKTPVASSTSSSTWATWDPSTSKTPVASSTSSSTWSAWSSWSSSTAAPSTTKTSTYSSSTSTSTTTPYTTTTPTYTPTTSSSSTSTSTTTSKTPVPTTCGASKSQFEAFPSGSCGCEFETYCNQGAAVDQNTKFWERTSGEVINSLAECQAICNDNTACTAVIWTDSPSAGSQDFKHCWQTSGLAAVSKDSYGQISYKGTCSSTCSGTYSG